MALEILVASTNPGKLSELEAMLDLNIRWRSLSDCKDIREVREDGDTFAHNARKKALGYAKQTGLWTIADDSGLVVDALEGKPGVNSARFSGEKPPAKKRELHDKKNMDKVLQLLEKTPTSKRTARFVCSICLATPEKVIIETKGKLQGYISDRPIGIEGFGYDPIFFVPDYGRTLAQLKPEQKNQISHRGKAIRNLKAEMAKIPELNPES